MSDPTRLADGSLPTVPEGKDSKQMIRMEIYTDNAAPVDYAVVVPAVMQFCAQRFGYGSRYVRVDLVSEKHWVAALACDGNTVGKVTVE